MAAKGRSGAGAWPLIGLACPRGCVVPDTRVHPMYGTSLSAGWVGNAVVGDKGVPRGGGGNVDGGHELVGAEEGVAVRPTLCLRAADQHIHKVKACGAHTIFLRLSEKLFKAIMTVTKRHVPCCIVLCLLQVDPWAGATQEDYVQEMMGIGVSREDAEAMAQAEACVSDEYFLGADMARVLLDKGKGKPAGVRTPRSDWLIVCFCLCVFAYSFFC